MRKYNVNGHDLSFDQPHFLSELQRAYDNHVRPLCLCNSSGIVVYLAQRNNKIEIRRMPGTGALHASECTHFQPDDDLTGLGQLIGHAVLENEDTGTIKLRLGFPLSRGSGRQMPEPTNADKKEIHTDGARLSLSGFIQFLWNDAGLTKFSPKMVGKRSWNIIRRELIGAMTSKEAKRQNLTETVFIPETFYLDHKYDIEVRRRNFVSHANHKSGKMMIVIAEVKEVKTTTNGKKLICKHLSDWPLYLDTELSAKLEKKFDRELNELFNGQGHLIVCATFSLDRSERAIVKLLSFMTTNENWIPYDNRDERIFVEKCTEQNRHFIKGMRMNYDESRPIANIILTDTKPLNTALYLSRQEMTEEYTVILEELMARAGNAHAIVDLNDPLPR